MGLKVGLVLSSFLGNGSSLIVLPLPAERSAEYYVLLCYLLFFMKGA